MGRRIATEEEIEPEKAGIFIIRWTGRDLLLEWNAHWNGLATGKYIAS